MKNNKNFVTKFIWIKPSYSLIKFWNKLDLNVKIKPDPKKILPKKTLEYVVENKPR